MIVIRLSVIQKPDNVMLRITGRLNDFHVFDLDTERWNEHAISSGTPSSRSGLGMTALGSRLFVFGGSNDNDGTRWLDSYSFTLFCQRSSNIASQ